MRRSARFRTVPGQASTLHGYPLPYTSQFDNPSPTDIPAAIIPVERIHGPVFLICGGADQVWLSCPYSQAIMSRLAAHHDRYPHVLDAYQYAGHGVGLLAPYEPVAGATLNSPVSGDSPEANPNALAQVWPHFLQFLAANTSRGYSLWGSITQSGLVRAVFRVEMRRRWQTCPTAGPAQKHAMLASTCGTASTSTAGGPRIAAPFRFGPTAHAESNARSSCTAMLACAYSCVIDVINAAAVNAEACAPYAEPWEVQAQPADSERLAGGMARWSDAHRSFHLD